VRRLVIIGHNGNANDILDMLEALRAKGDTWEVLGYLDDSGPSRGCLRQLPWLGRVEDARKWLPAEFILAVGSEHTYFDRDRIFRATDLGESSLCKLIHPIAQVSQTAYLGPGTVINFGSYIGASAILDTGVYLAPMVHIGHDTKIGAWSVLAPGAVVCGRVTLGRGVYVGAGSIIRNDVVVGDGALIGMGAVVTKHVPARSVVVGNPARVIRVFDPGANIGNGVDRVCTRS